MVRVTSVGHLVIGVLALLGPAATATISHGAIGSQLRHGVLPLKGSAQPFGPDHHHRPAPADPKPIPGGFALPGGPLLHVFAPGPPELGFMGTDVEPSTISSFNGFSALAYPAGVATDANGATYDMFNDMRIFRGEYVAVDGRHYHGSFAFV
jgi:hypothetical protein